MQNIQDLISGVEQRAFLPAGAAERFSGYGVMSLPFSTGHVLALRRFPLTSIGPGYTSVWLRRPSGSWTTYTDVAPDLSCPRYFGAALEAAEQQPVTVTWSGPNSFSVEVGGGVELRWDVELGSTPVTRLMTTVAGAVPANLWRNDPFLKAMGLVAGPVMRAGRIGLTGKVPNRQGFRASPQKMWIVTRSSASLGGLDLGDIKPLPVQTRLGDFWMPQRGIFMVGSVAFDAFDPAKHLPAVSA